MTSLALAFGAGLVVGWNILPQPAWVRTLYIAAHAQYLVWKDGQ